jgi:methionyl-tRNA formyltransferase
VDRLIRGLSPSPGAWAVAGGERLRLLRSRVAEEGSGAPGTVLRPLVVACGTGAVEVLEAQREGGKPLAAADLLRGWDPPPSLA